METILTILLMGSAIFLGVWAGKRISKKRDEKKAAANPDKKRSGLSRKQRKGGRK